MEVALPRALAETLDWLKRRPCERLSIREVAEGMGISYSAARYRLYALYYRGLIERHVTWTRGYVRGRWVTYRRVWFHYVPPPPPPPPRPLIAVVDSKTGYLIQYLETEYQGHRCWLYDEHAKKFIEPVTAIKVEKTISLKTPGHEDLIAEITAWTIISCADLPNIDAIADELEDRAKRWFREEKFANVDKYGNVTYSPFRFTEDFSIQEIRERAKYEMQIVEWYRTVTGEWAERPRVLKTGFGAYTTEETPIYPQIKVFTEYGHETEPVGTHREPPVGEETA